MTEKKHIATDGAETNTEFPDAKKRKTTDTPTINTTTTATTSTAASASIPVTSSTNTASINIHKKKQLQQKSNQSENAEELTDAVAASGVNLRAEEEAMVGGLTISKRQIEQNDFLKPHQLSWFITKAMEEQGLKTIEFDSDVINLLSAACEHYLSSVVTDSVIMSRHRRNSQKNNSRTSVSNSKSEISKALKDIATKHKEKEEKRLRRRIALGLEEDKKEEDIVEEHKQTNLTASMMMSGSKKKKYSWMQSSNGGNSSISSRGDNGIRYREAREEPGVVLRDLLSALENRRIGVSNVLVKGYSKMRD